LFERGGSQQLPTAPQLSAPPQRSAPQRVDDNITVSEFNPDEVSQKRSQMVIGVLCCLPDLKHKPTQYWLTCVHPRRKRHFAAEALAVDDRREGDG
jgi:hypothetical protein